MNRAKCWDSPVVSGPAFCPKGWVACTATQGPVLWLLPACPEYARDSGEWAALKGLGAPSFLGPMACSQVAPHHPPDQVGFLPVT